MAAQKSLWGFFYKMIGWSVASAIFGLFFHPSTPRLPTPPSQAIIQESAAKLAQQATDDQATDQSGPEEGIPPTTITAVEAAGAFGAAPPVAIH